MLNRFSQEIKKNIMKTHLEKENTITEIMNKTIQMMIATRYITEIRKRKKRPKKRIIYEDEIDGISEPDTDLQVREEEEQEQEAKPEINKNKKPKKLKKA